MQMKMIAGLLSLLTIGGCTSYQNSSSCPMADKYGKCINVEKAYEEAVTGVSQGEPMVPKSQKKKSPMGCNAKPDDNESLDEQSQSLVFENYQVRSYQSLAKQLDDPSRPLLLPPKTVRTLVLSYSSDGSKNRFFMPRFVYSIVQDTQWVGDQNILPSKSERGGLADSRQLSK
jgi:conjugal transfer pilus assembly protein TraV